MRRVTKIMLTVGAIALAATAASAAIAQPDRSTPNNWSWEIKDGKRVPKADRKVNADGSWREEVRQGTCVTIKEKTASGEYKESRRCD